MERVKASRGSGGIEGWSLPAFEVQLNPHWERRQRELKEDTDQPQAVRQHPIRSGTTGGVSNAGLPHDL